MVISVRKKKRKRGTHLISTKGKDNFRKKESTYFFYCNKEKGGKRREGVSIHLTIVKEGKGEEI